MPDEMISGIDIRIPRIPITIVIQEIMETGLWMINNTALDMISVNRTAQPRVSGLNQE